MKTEREADAISIVISQLIKGSKEKFFIKPNFRRKYQTSSSGQKFFGKKCLSK